MRTPPWTGRAREICKPRARNLHRGGKRPGFITATETVVLEVKWASPALICGEAGEFSQFRSYSPRCPHSCSQRTQRVDKGWKPSAKGHDAGSKSFREGAGDGAREPRRSVSSGRAGNQENHIPAAQEHLEKAVQLFPNPCGRSNCSGNCIAARDTPNGRCPCSKRPFRSRTDPGRRIGSSPRPIFRRTIQRKHNNNPSERSRWGKLTQV